MFQNTHNQSQNNPFHKNNNQSTLFPIQIKIPKTLLLVMHFKIIMPHQPLKIPLIKTVHSLNRINLPIIALVIQELINQISLTQVLGKIIYSREHQLIIQTKETNLCSAMLQKQDLGRTIYLTQARPRTFLVRITKVKEIVNNQCLDRITNLIQVRVKIFQIKETIKNRCSDKILLIKLMQTRTRIPQAKVTTNQCQGKTINIQSIRMRQHLRNRIIKPICSTPPTLQTY